MLESSQKLRELDLFERKLRLSPNGFLYDPLKFSLPDGDIAVIDDLFSFREYNNLMRHFPGAGAIGNPQAGVVQFYTGTKLWKGHDGVGWKEIFSENTPATGTGSVVRANAPTGTGQWIIPTINLTGGQIAFPAGAVPSADPNTLDDYEEGSWTPVFADAASGGNASGTVFTGTYIKIGSLISIIIQGVNIDTTGLTGANTSYIQNLPFTVAAINRVAGVTFVENVTFTGSVVGLATESSTYITLFDTISGGGGTIQINDLADDAAFIRLQMTYRV